MIETRFSVRMRVSQDGFSTEWLEQRVELWRRFCLPSIASQTAPEFTWLVLCDESTESGVLAELRSCEQEVRALEVVTTAADRSADDVVRSRVRDDADVLITTRLDSDDALADRFVESVQAYSEPFARSAHETLVINFPRGYRFDVAAGSLYENWMANGPFLSLLERPQRGRVETVLSAGHVMLPHLHPTHHDESLPAWLIAVHGGNLVNRIGPRARPRTVAGGSIPGFPASVMSPTHAVDRRDATR